MSKPVSMSTHTNNISKLIAIGGKPDWYWSFVRCANRNYRIRKGGDN